MTTPHPPELDKFAREATWNSVLWTVEYDYAHALSLRCDGPWGSEISLGVYVNCSHGVLQISRTVKGTKYLSVDRIHISKPMRTAIDTHGLTFITKLIGNRVVKNYVGGE